METLERRQLLSVSPGIVPADATTLSVPIGAHQARFVSFVDASGSTDIVTIKGPGTATVNFTGTALAASVSKGGELVSGSGITVNSIAAAGTSRRTALTIKPSRRGGSISIAAISADGAIGSISGTNVDVTGPITVGGTLGKVLLGGVDGGTTTASTGATIATTITASSIGSMTVGGNLADSLSVGGVIGSITVGGNLTGSIAATTLGKLTVRGSMSNSTITLGQVLTRHRTDLGRMTVGGAIINCNVNSAGNIGSITAGTLSGDNLYAGITLSGTVSSSRLPNAANEFTSLAALSSVKANSTTGTNVAAYTVGNVAFGNLQTANSGVPFGVSGVTINSITGLAAINGKKFKLKKLTNQALVAADLVKLGLTTAGVDFTVMIV